MEKRLHRTKSPMEKGGSFRRVLSVLVVLLLASAVCVGAGSAVEVANEAGLTAAIANGGEITLTADIKTTEQIAVSKLVTLDLNGYSIKNTDPIWDGDSWSLISVQDDGDLTIKDTSAAGTGLLQGIDNDCYGIDVRGGMLTINGGKYVASCSAVYVHDGEVIINGGTFDINDVDVQGDKRFLINALDANYKTGAAKITVNGGSFTGFDPSNSLSENPNGKFVPDGRKVTMTYNDADDTKDVYTVLAAVAKVGDVPYSTLKDAVEDAAKGSTVTLIADASGDGIVIDKDIIIDLGGHTYTITGNLVGSSGTETNGMQILRGSDGNIVTIKNGNLVITASSARRLIQNYADLTLTDVTLDASAAAACEYALSNNCGEVNLNGATAITSASGEAALDVTYWPVGSYKAGTQVTVDTTGTIKGTIEIGFYGDNGIFDPSPSKSVLTVKNINHVGSITVYAATSGTHSTGLSEEKATEMAEKNVNINGGTFSEAVKEGFCDAGYAPVTIEEGKYTVGKLISEFSDAKQTKPYTGDEQSFEIESDLTDFTVSYSQNDKSVKPINVGLYNVTITRAASSESDVWYAAFEQVIENGLEITQAVQQISFENPAISKSETDTEFTNPITQTGDGAISYTSSDETVATVDAATGKVTIVAAGTTTITAVAGATTNYDEATASYQLTVHESTSEIVITGDEGIPETYALVANPVEQTQKDAVTTSEQYADKLAGATIIWLNISLLDADGNEDHSTEITFTVPYPAGITFETANNYNFVVLHLKDDGTTVEHITAVTPTATGLKITSTVSPFAIGYTVKEQTQTGVSSTPKGSSVWLQEPATPTPTETVTPTETETVPTTQPTATETPESPLSVLAVLGGLGAVAVLRRK